jgi:hypothetical protein
MKQQSSVRNQDWRRKRMRLPEAFFWQGPKDANHREAILFPVNSDNFRRRSYQI